MAGILDGILGGVVGGDQANFGGGILGNINSGLTNNAGLLLGMGGALLGGQGFGQAVQNGMVGMQQDQRTRLLKEAQAEKVQKQQAIRDAAMKLGVDPNLAAASPEVFAAVATKKLVPKDPSFQEKLYNALPDDQKASAGQALLGLNKSQWQIKTIKNSDGSETPVYFNPSTMQTMPVPGFGTGQSKAAQQEAQAKQSADIVVQDIDRTLGITKDAHIPGIGVSTVTGGLGQVLSNVGGTKARDVSGLIATVKANATFDKLQQMRKASPTGGALGAVSEGENRLLGAAIGDLEQSQSEEQFVRNLKRVKKIYNGIIHGPQNVDEEGNVAPSAQRAVQGRGTTKSGVNWSVE